MIEQFLSIQWVSVRSFGTVNLRPVGIWRVTLLWGEVSPPVISKTTRLISKIQTLFDSPVRELSKHGVKIDLEFIDDVTSRVKSECSTF